MSLTTLQTKLGVTPDGDFGPGTITAAMKYFNLTSVRAAHFFAQTSHETGDFKKFSENLNYSTTGLRTTFSKYFPDVASAVAYERQPEKIANRVYANRMGNLDEASGDGWRYRGRGAIQLTGRANYTSFSKYCNRPDIITNPDLIATELAFESAIYFFDINNLWDICDQGINDLAITSLTKRVNGGTLGLDDRKNKTYKYYDWVKVQK
jgi:putative chitinase